MELLQHVAVGVEAERDRAGQHQGDVVLHDLDGGAIGAERLGLVLVSAGELVGALTCRVVVVAVAGAIPSTLRLAVAAEDGPVGRSERVAVHGDGHLVGLGLVGRAARQQDGQASDGGSCDADVHDSSFRLVSSHCSRGLVYSLGMSSTGSFSI